MTDLARNGDDHGMDIVTFLLARIAEDERRARSIEATWWMDGPFDPGRVLTECAAKRAVVTDAAEYEGSEMATDGLSGRVLALLATPYADHPDFDAAWGTGGTP